MKYFKLILTCFVEFNAMFTYMCFNKIGEKMNHIEDVFNNMIEDIKYIKLATYFKKIRK